jgi:hypothetical protein
MATADIDYNDYKVGDPDDQSGSKIKSIIFQNDAFIVFITDELKINWWGSPDFNYPKDFGFITNKVYMLNDLIDKTFVHKKRRLEYKELVGEAIARAVDEKDSKSALVLLNETEIRLKSHCKERTRMAYILWAFKTACLLIILLFLSLLAKDNILKLLNNSHNSYLILNASLLGGVGAFISSFFRFKNYEGAIDSGLAIHRLDGFLRIFYGGVAGLVVALAIKANLLFGFINNSETYSFYIILFLSMVGGASESFVPHIIKNIEDKAKVGEE